MTRFSDIDPRDIDPETNAPYSNYSTPALDPPFEDEPDDGCSDPAGHKFECTGTAYGGDDDSYHGEGRCFCIYCGADGDA